MITKPCILCLEEKEFSQYTASRRKDGSLYYRPVCHACKYTKEVLAGKVVDKDYHRSYYYQHKLDFKLKAYRHQDNSRFTGTETINMYDAISLMREPCFYCNLPFANGLDRRDNTQGHSKENVVPCCEKCNNILGDLPAVAKDHLKSGLTSIQQQNLLEQWTIPTKRNKKTNHLYKHPGPL